MVGHNPHHHRPHTIHPPLGRYNCNGVEGCETLMDAQTPVTHAAPNPLPRNWLRLLANEMVREFRRTGWRTHKTSRAWNPTGNPRATYGSASPVARSKLLTNTETFETVKFVRGTLDPVNALGVPPLAWVLTADDVSVLPAECVLALADLFNRNRGDVPFRVRRDRRGELTVTTMAYSCTEVEVTAVTLAAAAATVRVIDEADYWEALSTDFDAAFTLEILEGQRE